MVIILDLSHPVVWYIVRHVCSNKDSLNVKVVQKSLTLGHIFAKPKDPITKEQ